MSIDGTHEVEIHHVIKKHKGWEVTTFDFSSSISNIIHEFKTVLYLAAETMSRNEELEEKLKKQDEVIEVMEKALKNYANDNEPDYIWARGNAFECLAVNFNHDDSIAQPLGTWAKEALEKVEKIRMGK